MISVKERTLHEAIYNGIREAKKQGRSLLVSHVEKVNQLNPITFFNNSGVAFTGQRFFWSSPEGMILTGAGVAASFDAKGTTRAQHIKAEWEQVLTHRVANQATTASGTGPLLIGGFSFDPADSRDSRWSGFPDAGFNIPMFMLTIKGVNTWLTINSWVNAAMEADELANRLNETREMLLKNRSDQNAISQRLQKINDLDAEAWIANVKKATTLIAEGELDKVVLAREVEIQGSTSFSICSVLNHLTENQKNSYVFAFEKEDMCFIGATPERLIERRGNTFLTGALAGTAARGKSMAEDQRLEKELLKDAKNRKEHDYVVKMIGGAMASFTEELTFPEQPEILKVKDVQHLYTPISGIAKDHVSLLDIVEKLHPTPALGGQPREKAMTLIQQLEAFNRGWYASPIGWLDAEGYGEFAVAIRSALINSDRAWAYAGCGVVEASDPVAELEETRLKLKPMLAALGGGREREN